MMLKRIIFSLHRILGTILSILFLVWFLSGFVMLFHSFPKVTPEDRYLRLDPLCGELPPADSIPVKEPLDKLVLKMRNEALCFDTGTGSQPQPAYTDIENYARRWCDTDVASVDTLAELDQWIPFGRLKNDFPIYRFNFADKDRHQLYVSSKGGEALQFTDRDSRFWAWLGPIPHWIYFTSLRQNSQLWVDVVVWLSGLGSIMCLAGIILGVRSYVRRYRRKKKWQTPYRKVAYKWHHITGFVFGIFVFTFTFSGMMSLAAVPQWIAKVHRPGIHRELHAGQIVLSNYKADYRDILRMYGDEAKSIEWASFGDTPLYKAVIRNKVIVFDASRRELKILNITAQMVRERLLRIHREPVDVTLMHEYDNYYVDRKRNLPLPVYRADVADADNSTYYIVPYNGHITYFNTNTKIRRYAYQALHCFNLGFLVKRPALWNIAMWTAMIGGTLVSVTGVWLGFRYAARKFRRIRRRLTFGVRVE